MSFSDQHSRRLAAGSALIAGPGLALVGWSLVPSVEGDNAKWVGEIAGASTRAATGLVLVIVGLTLSVLAYLSLVHLLRERQPFAGDVGGALAVIGTVLMVALLGGFLVHVESVQHLGDSAETVALVEAAYDGSLGLFGIGPVLATVGLLVLAVGLFRAHSVPPLVAVLLGFGAVVQPVGFILVESLAVGIAGTASLFLALAAMGVQLLTAPDREWEHAPVFHGFHRVSAT